MKILKNEINTGAAHSNLRENVARFSVFPLLACMLGIVLAGCEAPSSKGVQIYEVTQPEVNALADCQSQAPEATLIYDPLNGFHAIIGQSSARMRQCLVDRHGWKALGPPEYAEGTMQPPNR